jgi:GTP cyclohydrolase I
MSRFIEVLDQNQDEVTMRTLPSILKEIKQRLEAESARIEIVFPYFIERSAPVSGRKALMDYECTLTGEMNDGHDDFVLGVKVPVTSLCPCSKTISDYGAHSQRGYITIEVRGVRQNDCSPAPIWIEEIIDIAEKSASAPVYPLLKRDDERHVTMQAYDHPVFVEDMVRDAATRLQADARVEWFRVYAINHESIHRHNAFAQVSWPGVSLDEVLCGSIHGEITRSAGHDGLQHYDGFPTDTMAAENGKSRGCAAAIKT